MSLICKNCGKEFELKKRGRKNGGFCCKNCADRYRIKNKEPKYTKVCEYCGKEFKTNSATQKCCSVTCNGLSKRGRTIHKIRCLGCGVEFETIDPKRKFCESKCSSIYYGNLRKGNYYCEYCGKPRHSDHPNRNRFCSPECAVKARVLEYLPIKLAKQKAKEEEREQRLQKICPVCGQSFMARNSSQRYCSLECYESNKAVVYRQRGMENYTPRSFHCIECGRLVETTYGDGRQSYCSEECAARSRRKRYKENRKQQMEKAYREPVSLKAVYLRAKGICEICGLPVPMTTEPTNPWAATRDHIVPLSRDGLHTKDNVQLAHRMCNSMKQGFTETYKVDWSQLLRDEPGRWNKQLDNLWEQIGEEYLSDEAG